MKTHKNLFIEDIQEGKSIEDFFLIKSVNQAETRNGKPYLILTIMDRTGELGGRLWENTKALLPLCEPGKIVLLKGQAQSYKGILQVKVDSISAIDQISEIDFDRGDYLPSTSEDISAMKDEVISMAQSVEEPNLQQLLLLFFQPGNFLNTFMAAPAAKIMHHAYYGGLLEHTLSVARLSVNMSDMYSDIDRDLLITGALLHDIGKIKEFTFDAYPINYSDKGRLVGHLVMGVEMVQERISLLPDFPEELVTRLKHLILSHHGRYEFGSPCLPMTLEAFVLHFIDDMDSKINYLNRLSSQIKEKGYQWTEYQKTLERFLYVRGDIKENLEKNIKESLDQDEPLDSKQLRIF